MEKNDKKTGSRDMRKALFVREAAGIAGVSQRQAQRVEAGNSRNEKVMASILMLDEGYNLLLTEVKRVVGEL